MFILISIDKSWQLKLIQIKIKNKSILKSKIIRLLLIYNISARACAPSVKIKFSAKLCKFYKF